MLEHKLEFFFRWSLYGVPWGMGYFSRQLISETEWTHKATTGSEGPHMAVDPVVARFTRNSSYSYYFSVKTWRWGTSESHCGMYYVFCTKHVKSSFLTCTDPYN